MEENFDLTSLNTFGVSQSARYFARFSSVTELKVLLEASKGLTKNIFCLGGGSNILLTAPFEGLILRNEIPGQEVLHESADDVRLKVGAGVVWHKFVSDCVAKGWGGVENLSLIPGTVGAAPIQNIGAYGVEVKDVIHCVHVFDREEEREFAIKPGDCHFGYRDSVFKHQGKNRWIVTAVEFRLSKKPLLKTQYGAIEAELQKMKIAAPTLKDVAQAVIRIRQTKLPDPAVLGNAGSFFKNPVLPEAQFEKLKKAYPKIVGYPDRPGHIKVPAGWLIEAAGLKGCTEGACGVHKDQALVLVNFGGASGQEILQLAYKVQAKVREQFQIELEMEVNIL